MSLSKSAVSLLSCDINPLKIVKNETNTAQTQACTEEDRTSIFESITDRNLDSPTNEHFSSEDVSIKLQILARTGMNASRISLLSGCSGRPSFAQSEEIKSNVLLIDKVVGRNGKGDQGKANEAKIREEFRSKYISNLRHMNILDSQSKKKHQSIMLIDWDGALFGGIDIEEVKNNQKFIKAEPALKVLDETASKLLAKAVEYCSVFIITSYNEKLVEYSASLYLPMTSQIIKTRNIQIVASPIGAENEDPSPNATGGNKPRDIRKLADIRDKFGDDLRSHFICVVDSETKINVIQKLTEKFEGALVKFLQFKECVKVNQLIKQQELLIKEFDNIFSSLRSFTMQFAKNQSKK